MRFTSPDSVSALGRLRRPHVIDSEGVSALAAQLLSEAAPARCAGSFSGAMSSDPQSSSRVLAAVALGKRSARPPLTGAHMLVPRTVSWSLVDLMLVDRIRVWWMPSRRCHPASWREP